MPRVSLLPTRPGPPSHPARGPPRKSPPRVRGPARSLLLLARLRARSSPRRGLSASCLRPRRESLAGPAPGRRLHRSRRAASRHAAKLLSGRVRRYGCRTPGDPRAGLLHASATGAPSGRLRFATPPGSLLARQVHRCFDLSARVRSRLSRSYGRGRLPAVASHAPYSLLRAFGVLPRPARGGFAPLRPPARASPGLAPGALPPAPRSARRGTRLTAKPHLRPSGGSRTNHNPLPLRGTGLSAALRPPGLPGSPPARRGCPLTPRPFWVTFWLDAPWFFPGCRHLHSIGGASCPSPTTPPRNASAS